VKRIALSAAVLLTAAGLSPLDLGSIAWRDVGPAVLGGRLDAVAGVPGDPRTIFLGHSSGGLYKSTDGGLTFAAVFSAGTSTAIGAVAVAPSDPRVVVVGTGEGFPRNTAAVGDGVFASKNGGKTWRSIGLRQSEHIAKIAIDPRDPRVILVAALGPEWSPGGERGIYRTQDGGATWTRVLYVNPTTGGSDVIFDPHDPKVVYAGTFDFLRRPWTFRGGGPGSGLFRSADNGRTWTKLTDPRRHDGLPGGTINRVGVSLSYDHPAVVYALVPTKHGILYRSNDAGAHWSLVNASPDLVFRPFYFSQVRADPKDPNRVYLASGGNSVSTDGGKKFVPLGGGGDNHDLWIDPKDPDRILNGSDMGFDLSVDRGETWSLIDTVPFAQVYRVGYDRATPYHIMGGMQDHEVWWGPNTLWNDDGVTGGAWRNISQWGDGQYALADPLHPDVVYEDTHFGDIVRRDLGTGEARFISPQPLITFGTGARSFPYRFSWSAPIAISPNDPEAVYFGGNVLFRTTDRGAHWQTVSPDLSQPCDPAKLGPSGGPLVHDNTNAETYCTIYAISEDAGDAKTLWAGTDNGHLDITRDGGATWRDVVANVPGLPPESWVASIRASETTPGTAYVAFDRHRFGDRRPYAYVTTDHGATWRNVSRGLSSYVFVVLEDPRQPDLLFAGTERGVWASFDRGAHWMDLQLGEPPVPVYDLKIQPDANDLIAGTHGRGFAILDDLAPLERLAAATRAPAALFAPATVWRYVSRPVTEYGRGEFVAPNKPYGATLTYYLSPQVASKKKGATVDLRILDGAGRVVRTLRGPAKRGLDQVVWDLQTDPPGGRTAVQDARPYYVFYSLHVDGPEVVPGTYTAQLMAGGRTYDAPVEVRLDPALTATPADVRAQFDAMMRLAAMQERDEVALNELRGLDAQIAALATATMTPALRAQVAAYRADAAAIAAALANGDGSENAAYREPAQLIDQIGFLRHILAGYVGPPTAAQQASIERFDARSDELGARAKTVFIADLDRLNRALGAEHLGPLRVRVTPPKHRRRPAPPAD